jgi:hypothetical protein
MKIFCDSGDKSFIEVKHDANQTHVLITDGYHNRTIAIRINPEKLQELINCLSKQ